LPKISPAHEQHRRTQILAAAHACFARQGYRATSMDDVVRESGLSVGAIYTYFPSKEDLFLALAEQRSNDILGAMNELFRRPAPMADKFQQAIDEVEVEPVAELLMALNEGLVLLSALGVRRVPLDALKAAYTSFIDHGLADPAGQLLDAQPLTAAAANGQTPRIGAQS
jgi:AcrR family transcriptional regulator